VAWTTEYLGLAVAGLRTAGRQVDEELLALISPAHNENVGFYGTFSFDVDRELAQLTDGYRPLRQASRRAGWARAATLSVVFCAKTTGTPPSEPPDAERLGALAAEYGIEILGPPGIPS
jgi:hypothetical protein